jgi:hypothetical protein
MNTTTEKWVGEMLEILTLNATRIYIPHHIDLQKTTADEWLSIISRNSNKNTTFTDTAFVANTLRSLKKLPKIATKVKISNEYIVMSSFLNVMIDREKIDIKEEEGNDLKEFTKKPYNFDYQISSKDIRKVLEDELEYLFDGKKNKWEIFSVKSHGDTIAPCPYCIETELIKCKHCNGSGREQYVDGYFATGEKRIKTGQCSHCYGQGKITCAKCNNTRTIHLNTGQTVKRFEDRKTILRCDCVSAPWGAAPWRRDPGLGDFHFMDWYTDEDFFNDIKENYRYYIREYNNIDIWRNMDDDELEDSIEKLYRNSKEIIIDKEDESARKILSEIGDKYKTLCKENKKCSNLLWRHCELEKGELACSLVKHHAIPAVKITFTDTIEKQNNTICIFENLKLDENGERRTGTVCVFENGLPELSFIKSLFL